MRPHLKRAREELGLTGTEAAYRLGISFHGYSAIERGVRDPRGSTCVKMVELFNLPLAELLFVQHDSTTSPAQEEYADDDTA